MRAQTGEDPTLISKQQIFARVVGALGGRAAEEVIFGDAEVTSGASSDLQQVRVGCWVLTVVSLEAAHELEFTPSLHVHALVLSSQPPHLSPPLPTATLLLSLFNRSLPWRARWSSTTA
jgi:hypothetical protein